VTHPESLPSAAVTCELLREAGLGPVILGGQAIDGDEHARALGADLFATDAASMIRLLDELSMPPAALAKRTSVR